MKSRENMCFRERVARENKIAQQFSERWGWMVDEYDKARQELHAVMDIKPPEDQFINANLKPFPTTSAGIVGWLSSRRDCQLEVFGPDVLRAPPLPDMYVVTRLYNPLSDGLEYCK